MANERIAAKRDGSAVEWLNMCVYIYVEIYIYIDIVQTPRCFFLTITLKSNGPDMADDESIHKTITRPNMPFLHMYAC